MKENFTIDDAFRAKLLRAEAVPPPAVWGYVAAELARQKRRRLIGFWTAGGVATAMLLAGAGLFFLNESPAAAAPILTAQNEAPVTDRSAENAIPEKSTGAAAAESTSGFSEKTGAGAASAGVFEKGLSQKTPPALSKKSGAATGGSKLEKLGDGQPSQPDFSTQAIDNQPVVLFEKGEVATSPAETFDQKEGSATADRLSERAGLDLLESRGPSLFEQKKTAQLPPVKRFKSKKRKPVCPSFADRGEVFFLDFYAGAGATFRSLTANDHSDSPGCLARRKATESDRFTWTAGARGGWLFAGRYVVRAGLQLAQVQERFKFYDPNDFTYTVFVNPSTGERDTTLNYGEHFLERTNLLHFVDLPLTVGVEQSRGRFGWGLHGGAAANLLFFKNGKIVDPETKKPAARKPTLRTNAGISLVANAQFFYQTDKRSRLFVEPFYQKVLRPVSQKSAPVVERYGFGGVSVGYTRLLK